VAGDACVEHRLILAIARLIKPAAAGEAFFKPRLRQRVNKQQYTHSIAHRPHHPPFPVRIPLKPERRMISATGPGLRCQSFVLVRVETEDGIFGVGEATVHARIGAARRCGGALAIIERLFAPALIGCNPLDQPLINSRLDALRGR